MTDGLELVFTPGDPSGFIGRLWSELPAHPEGTFVGAIHLVGDRGQIVVRVADPQVGQITVRPGQVFLAPKPGDARTWSVVDRPDHGHLKQPG